MKHVTPEFRIHIKVPPCNNRTESVTAVLSVAPVSLAFRINKLVRMADTAGEYKTVHNGGNCALVIWFILTALTGFTGSDGALSGEI